MKHSELLCEGWFSKSKPIQVDNINEIVLTIDIEAMNSAQRRGNKLPSIRNLKDWFQKQLTNHSSNIVIDNDHTIRSVVNKTKVDNSAMEFMKNAIQALNNHYPNLHAKINFVPD